MSAFLEYLIAVYRPVAALVAAFLPRRRWDAFPELPIARMAVLSGTLTCLAAIVFGVVGFLAHAQRAADALAGLTLHVAERQARYEIGGEVTTTMMQGASGLSIVSFLFLTPLGLCMMYLAVTGLLRGVAALVDDPVGDPLLTAIDRVVTRRADGLRRARDRRARERLEGEEVPDRLWPAQAVHAAGFDYVVVSSRRKTGWTPGTFVITSDKWYTVGEAFEVRLPGGLRTLYPLKEQRTNEVLRRAVQYELPPLEPRAAAPRAGSSRGPGDSPGGRYNR